MTTKELQLLQVAILNEVEGETFYRLAAEHLGSEEIRTLLLHLADEEVKHQQSLRKLYQGLSTGQNLSQDLNWSDIPSTGIFDLMKLGRLKSNLEISVISTGVLMEKASMDYYDRALEQTDHMAVKQLCQYLSRWEREHMEKLERIYDYLKEEWYEQQGFSPA